MKLGLVGYGFGGRVFHAPFIQAAEGVEIAGVVARSADKIAQLAKDLPGVPVYSSLAEMAAAGEVEMVTITTPPETHKALTLEAIELGLHVVCDKPFAPTYPDAAEMVEAAKAKGVLLNVFHNRRWDTDFRTLKSVVESGRLGDIRAIHNRLDADDWATLEAGPGGGLLRDHGSHFIDQMLFLLGPAAAVDAKLDYMDLPQGTTDVSYAVHVRHQSGQHSYITGSKVNYYNEREFRAYGSLGTYVGHGTDVQARMVMAGHMPADDPAGWGIEPKEAWGTLHTEGNAELVPSVQSKIQDLYTQFAQAAQSGGPGPVPATGALHTMRVLDAAREASETGQTVLID